MDITHAEFVFIGIGIDLDKTESDASGEIARNLHCEQAEEMLASNFFFGVGQEDQKMYHDLHLKPGSSQLLLGPENAIKFGELV